MLKFNPEKKKEGIYSLGPLAKEPATWHINENGWNISKTAELLDIQRSHLYNKMKKYGIEKGE